MSLTITVDCVVITKEHPDMVLWSEKTFAPGHTQP